MELLQLTYFCDAAETENFSKTAKKFFVPASNISQSIHRLETELGAALFDRSANKVRLNERGQILYKNAKEALLLLKSAEEKIRDREEISGEIKILAETNRRVVTQVIESFQSRHKDVTFFINHAYDRDIGQYDFIITDKDITNKSLERKPWVADEILLALKKSHPLSKKSRIDVKELEGERFITMNQGSSLYNITNEICSLGGFKANIVILSEDPNYIRKYVEMGLGISFVPTVSWEGLFSEDIALKRVVLRKRETYVYYKSEKYMTGTEKLFLEELEKFSVSE